ncbi:MAG: efflux RND transporter periplasmic adaptor subunit [Planctomycetota bacterium]|jgi:HlyD family secretion protein
MTWVKRCAILIIGLGIIAGIVWGVLPKPIASDVSTVSRGSLRIEIQEEGKTRVVDRFSVTSPIIAEKTRTKWKAGDNIKKGDEICLLTPLHPSLHDSRTLAQLKANIHAANSNLERAESQITASESNRDFLKREFERKQDLLAKKHISREEVDAAHTKWQSAEAELTSAKRSKDVANFQYAATQAALIETNSDEALPSLSVKSPVDGCVLSVASASESAGPVSVSQPLIVIGDLSKLEIVVELLTRQAVTVTQGDRVEIGRWGGSQLVTGSVKTIEPGGFTKTSSLGVEEQRTNVIIAVDGGDKVWTRVNDGFRVEVKILVEEHKNVIKAASGALFSTQDGDAVFVVRDGVAVHQPVQIGANNGVEVLIAKGLNEGDDVILHPAEEINDGTKIIIR